MTAGFCRNFAALESAAASLEETIVLPKQDELQIPRHLAASKNFTLVAITAGPACRESRQTDEFSPFSLEFGTSGDPLVELRSAPLLPKMPYMFFGDEYLGRAVAFLRHGKDWKQHQLAARIGVKPGTMNQYESGRRGMSEETVARIAGALEIGEIEIWDTAYRIFRYNCLRERAEREGTTLEALIAHLGSRPSIDQILQTYDSRAEHDRRFVDLVFRFLEALGRNGLDGTHLLEIVVQTRSPRGSRETRKAVRLTRKRGTASP